MHIIIIVYNYYINDKVTLLFSKLRHKPSVIFNLTSTSNSDR